MQHAFHSCNEEDCYPCGGGLAVCVICKGAEGSLPTECPGAKMTSEQDEAIMAGKLDYVDGKWVEKS